MRKATAVILCLTLLVTQMVWAQTNDIQPDHWAYESVKSLANKGLVLGYPDGNFLGNRNITRYEMATIIARVLNYIDQSMVSTPAQKPSTVAPGNQTASTALSVSPEDLATVKKLVDEYKVELTVIGTDLKNVQEEL